MQMSVADARLWRSRRADSVTSLLLLASAAWAAWAAAGTALAHDQIPAAAQTQPVAIIGATIHPVSAAVIPDGTIVFDAGRIVAIGAAVQVPPGARVIDLRGQGRHVYPGLFDAASEIGLVEFPSVRATRDTTEAGTINPNVRANVAVNPDSELIPVARSNGVLLALSMPQPGAGAVSMFGQSSVMMLDGWTWEEMTLRDSAGMHLRWPTMTMSAGWGSPDAATAARLRDEALATLEQTFDDAGAYRLARTAAAAATAASTTQPAAASQPAASTQPVLAGAQAVPFDARWEAMIPLLEGRLPLIVHAEESGQILAAVAFAHRRGLRLIVVGGHDADLCADILASLDVPVILTGVQRVSRRPDDPYDAAYTLPQRLREAGVRFCIAGNRGPAQLRNLPYHAGAAVAFGLSSSDALAAITLWPAEILGVNDRVGSLAVGKDATLFVADGDILETPTNVHTAFIQGREVDLRDKQKRLRDKYQTKYRQ